MGNLRPPLAAGIAVLCLGWALPSRAGPADSEFFAIADGLVTSGILEIRARGSGAGGAAARPPPRRAVERALTVYFGYDDVAVLHDKLAWASLWSLSPGTAQVFHVSFSARGVVDGLRIGGLEHVLQTYLRAAGTGILVEAASISSLKVREIGLDPRGGRQEESDRHAWSAGHGSGLTASVASSIGVALAFGAACLASSLCQRAEEPGDRQPRAGCAAAAADRDSPRGPGYVAIDMTPLDRSGWSPPGATPAACVAAPGGEEPWAPVAAELAAAELAAGPARAGLASPGKSETLYQPWKGLGWAPCLPGDSPASRGPSGAAAPRFAEDAGYTLLRPGAAARAAPPIAVPTPCRQTSASDLQPVPTPCRQRPTIDLQPV